MVSGGALVGDVVSGSTEEESVAGRYTESLGKPMVYLFWLGISPRLRDPFLMLGKLWFGLSPETSRGS